MTNELYPQLWKQKVTEVQGKTVFGYFDMDQQFKNDAKKFAILAGRKLGFPVVDVQLTQQSFYTAFQNAIMQYSSIINQFNIKQNMLSMHGVQYNETTNLTHKPINQNFSRIIRLSQQYANQVGIGDVEIHQTHLILQPFKQTYDLRQLFNGQDVQIHKIYYQKPPTSLRIWDPYLGGDSLRMMQGFGWSNMGVSSQYVMMPMSADLLRMNAISMSDQFRRATYDFHIQGTHIRFFPTPNEQMKVLIQYVKNSQRFDLLPQYLQDDKDYISDPSNAPFQFMQYSKINSVGRSWILSFAYAVVKGMLGSVRGKLQSIPIPGGQISLDGDSLKSQSSNQIQQLKEKLREYLQNSSRKTLMQIKKEQTQNLKQSLNDIPLKIFIG